MNKLIHGGDLYAASIHYNVAESDWIDLSTGLNPVSYPCGEIPQEAFSKLPYTSQKFLNAVKTYYGDHDFIPISGSQEIIQALPGLLSTLPVVLPSVGYQEHERAWKNFGAKITYYDALYESNAQESIDAQLQKNPQQHLVVINPNNPSGLTFSRNNLFEWANVMEGDARLIVDEAFIDLLPEQSLLKSATLPTNILVLRSCGKFFGLGGIRAGFLFGSSCILSNLALPSNPWPINGIAQHILCKALLDNSWHSENKARINESADFMKTLLKPLHLNPLCEQGLFLSYFNTTNHLKHLYKTFAKAGILLRLIPVNSSHSILRIGLLEPSDETSISRVRNCIAYASRRAKSNDQL